MQAQVLTSILNEVAAIAVPVGLLALSVSTVFVLVGWRRRRDLLERQGRPFVAGRLPFERAPLAAGVLDIAAAATAIFRQFDNLAAQRLIALELAVQPGLAVCANPCTLEEILVDLIRDSIEQSLCGRVLFAAAYIDGRVQITVSDDAGHVDRESRAARLRPVERLAALQGATMDIDAQAGQGTTVILYLPAAGATERPPAADQRAWRSAEREREGSNAGR